MWLDKDNRVWIIFGHVVLKFGIKIKSHNHNAINKYHSQYITFQLIFQLTHTLSNHIPEYSIKHKLPLLYFTIVFFLFIAFIYFSHLIDFFFSLQYIKYIFSIFYIKPLFTTILSHSTKQIPKPNLNSKQGSSFIRLGIILRS